MLVVSLHIFSTVFELENIENIANQPVSQLVLLPATTVFVKRCVRSSLKIPLSFWHSTCFLAAWKVNS